MPITVIYEGQRWNVLHANPVRCFITRDGETKWVDVEEVR